MSPPFRVTSLQIRAHVSPYALPPPVVHAGWLKFIGTSSGRRHHPVPMVRTIAACPSSFPTTLISPHSSLSSPSSFRTSPQTSPATEAPHRHRTLPPGAVPASSPLPHYTVSHHLPTPCPVSRPIDVGAPPVDCKLLRQPARCLAHRVLSYDNLQSITHFVKIFIKRPDLPPRVK
jgi:hypothetical protein